MSAAVRRPNALRDVVGGAVAVGIKELRGRMRGRRAFVLLTVHLLAVAGFAFFVETVAVGSISPFGGGPQSADIGRVLFDAMLIFLTIVVLILAPSSTSGAISLEREKQTLDMLVTTPVSSLAIVLGKLVAALGWMALLLLASIPVMALVFMFGGVGPEELVRAYTVLGVTAVMYSSLGLFISALFKRTQASTVLNLVLAVVFTLGTGGLFLGLLAMDISDAQEQATLANGSVNWSTFQGPPPVLLWANPFAADMDVLCHADTSTNGVCAVVLVMTGRFDIAQGGGAALANGQAFAMPEDSYWPVSVAAMLVVTLLLILGATQLISPTRRWRRPRPRTRGSPDRGGAALAAAAVDAPPTAATADLPPAGAPARVPSANAADPLSALARLPAPVPDAPDAVTPDRDSVPVVEPPPDPGPDA